MDSAPLRPDLHPEGVLKLGRVEGVEGLLGPDLLRGQRHLVGQGSGPIQGNLQTENALNKMLVNLSIILKLFFSLFLSLFL